MYFIKKKKEKQCICQYKTVVLKYTANKNLG